MTSNADLVRRELARFDPSASVEAASTPPASWYLEPAFFERERETVFRRTWQFACATDQVARPGDHVRVDLLGESYVVLRDDAGTLRAFHNVCRHHAAQIVEGCGNTQSLVCPYHGWTYDLRGALVRAPKMGRLEHFDRAAFSLPTVPVEAWGPLVFLHPGTPARPVADELGQLAEILERTDLSDLRWLSRRRYPMACNWKVFVDNYLDGGYHIAHLHHGLASQIDLDTYRTELFEGFNVQFTASRAGAVDRRGHDFAARIGDGAVYAWIYPNLMLNRYGPILDSNYVVPIDEGHCEVIFDYWYPEDADETFVERSLTASDDVQQEDVTISESVQRGVRSSSYDQGRYAGTEAGMYQFHRLLAADLARA